MTSRVATPARSVPARSPSRARRILRWLVILVVALLIVINVVLPIGLAAGLLIPQRAPVGAVPEGFEDVALTTADGVTLRGWFAPPRNGAALVVVHGAMASREQTRPYSDLLRERGFGVLAIELRGHGASDGPTHEFGWGSAPDIAAAIRYLQEQECVDAIGGLGISLGGEMLLGALAAHPELRAVVSDGASARSFEEYQALPAKQNVVMALSPWVFYRAVALLTGAKPPAPTLVESIRAADTPLLLVAAGNNADEAAYNALFAEIAGPRAELWVAPGVDHTGAFARYPDEYAARLAAFFADHLLAAP